MLVCGSRTLRKKCNVVQITFAVHSQPVHICTHFLTFVCAVHGLTSFFLSFSFVRLFTLSLLTSNCIVISRVVRQREESGVRNICPVSHSLPLSRHARNAIHIVRVKCKRRENRTFGARYSLRHDWGHELEHAVKQRVQSAACTLYRTTNSSLSLLIPLTVCLGVARARRAAKRCNVQAFRRTSLAAHT